MFRWLCSALLELGLRLGGFGYPTSFLLPSSNQGQKTWVQNNQFGWRFFGARKARLPQPISIPRDKPPGTIRIFVFGESAAFGDPQPRFGLPRMLNAMLGLRHPGKKFEVVNAAMTGINSHVILPLARDCEEARGDVWVIYMGNNEVVGPFGAGTVFGNQTTPLPLIRAGLALKATRTGQLLDALRGSAEKTGAGSGEWEGMRMFIKYKLARFRPAPCRGLSEIRAKSERHHRRGPEQRREDRREHGGGEPEGLRSIRVAAPPRSFGISTDGLATPLRCRHESPAERGFSAGGQ